MAALPANSWGQRWVWSPDRVTSERREDRMCDGFRVRGLGCPYPGHVRR